MKLIPAVSCLFMAALIAACQSSEKSENRKADFRLITLDPGHFHAALVQKTMYEGVDSTVHVYAPDGPDLQVTSGQNRGLQHPRRQSDTLERRRLQRG